MDDHSGCAEAALAGLPHLAHAAGETDYAPCPAEAARAELDAGRRAGAVPLFLGTAAYPALLAEIDDAPPMLWALGDLALLARPAVAVAGARSASSLGLRMARALARGLAEAGFVVVSGLARGIDAAAHAAAMDTTAATGGSGGASGGTIAVFAGGVDVVYPEENAALAARLREAGLILSEMPPGTRPQARHFPRRNRIVSGLARATVVVEAAAKSGSLITAREAADQGREVMAVPGHPFDARAAGCNMLLRDGATLVRGARDVLEALGAEAAPAVRSDGPRAAVPSPEGGRARAMARAGARLLGRRALGAAPEVAPPADATPRVAPADAASARARVLDRLSPSPAAEDQVLRDTGLSRAAFAAALTDLELDGAVLRSPGGLISRPG